MISKTGLPIQKKCAVAFIDVLGISKKIEKESQWALDWMWLCYNEIMDEMKNYERIKIRIFSDNILICEEINENDPKSAVLDVLAIIDKIELQQLKLGALFFRGAMVVDDLYFGEHFVYGAGLLKSYKMENESVIFPRVVIDSSVLAIIQHTKSFISLDKDGQYFYDYLQSRIRVGGKRLSQELSTLSGNIAVNIASNSTSVSIINKMEWLVNYFNDSCKKNGLKHRITECDINRFGLQVDSLHIIAKTK